MSIVFFIPLIFTEHVSSERYHTGLTVVNKTDRAPALKKPTMSKFGDVNNIAKDILYHKGQYGSVLTMFLFSIFHNVLTSWMRRISDWRQTSPPVVNS